MRIAIVSDIHGNRFAFDAVLADLRDSAPDLVLHGGDLAHGGSSPAYVLDRIRELGWQGVMGNTDEMLFRPEALQEFAQQTPKLQSMFAMIAEMAAWDREALGAQRLDWLRTLPSRTVSDSFALVHASPGDCWRSPGPEADDDKLHSIYSVLGRPLVVYAHIHRPYVRNIYGKTQASQPSRMFVANTGSVSLSHDGDPRASYLLIDDSTPQIRRVTYEVEKEVQQLANCGMPHANWITRTLRAASPQAP
jgi:predicted phosphodiesterase